MYHFLEQNDCHQTEKINLSYSYFSMLQKLSSSYPNFFYLNNSL